MLIDRCEYDDLDNAINQLIGIRDSVGSLKPLSLNICLDYIIDDLLEIYNSIVDSKDIEVENNI